MAGKYVPPQARGERRSHIPVRKGDYSKGPSPELGQEILVVQEQERAYRTAVPLDMINETLLVKMPLSLQTTLGSLVLERTCRVRDTTPVPVTA